jgi:hypothetical protein
MPVHGTRTVHYLSQCAVAAEEIADSDRPRGPSSSPFGQANVVASKADATAAATDDWLLVLHILGIATSTVRPRLAMVITRL